MPDYSLSATPRPRAAALLLACAALAGGYFVQRDVLHYFTLDPKVFTDYYWSRRGALLTHVSAGLVALSLGMVQVWLGVTGRTRGVHRALGRLYLSAALIGAVASFYLAATIPPPVTLYNSGLVGLGIAWVLTSALGYAAARRGALARHRRWMLRSYVVTFGFVTLRGIEGSLRVLGIGSDDSRFSAAAWLCWTVPLLLLELWLRWPRAGGAGPRQRLQTPAGSR